MFSKEKAPSGSDSRPQSAKKTLFPELEGTEIEISGFMVQVLNLLRKLNDKVDNVATRLLFVERKLRKLKKEVKAGKGTMEEEEDDEEDDEEDEEKEEENEEEAEKEKGGNEEEK